MFTGLVECTGSVVSLHGKSGIASLTVTPRKNGGEEVAYVTALGDSVAVNGVCLTVTANKDHALAFDVSSETLARTMLGDLKEGDVVNLERAVRVGDRLGGHLVSGHVDALVTVTTVDKKKDGWFVEVAAPAAFRKYVTEKGSICLDGVSLTINQFRDEATRCLVALMLIPATVAATNLSLLKVGQKLNAEFDQMAKYVERLVAVSSLKF